MSESPRDRVLIVENDPLISDLVSRQALQSIGCQSVVVSDATDAINRALQLQPDLVLASLDLPGLSGKDLLVALSSHNLRIPVIVLAKKGQEASIIQAFRLGAVDYLLWPFRETEVITVVEQVLKQVHEQRENEHLARRLQQTSQELQLRVRELTTILSLGKTITSTTHPTVLQDKILEAAVRACQADLGWLLLRQPGDKTLRLVAQVGLPESLAQRLNQPWDDGLSSMVALTGDLLAIHGDPLKRFKISAFGQAAVVIPIKIQKQVTALLVLVRHQLVPFTPGEQSLLVALADFASSSLANAHQFSKMEERALLMEKLATQAQTGEKIDFEILQQVKAAQLPSIDAVQEALNILFKGPLEGWTAGQQMALAKLKDHFDVLASVARSIQPERTYLQTNPGKIDLCAVVRESVKNAALVARQNKINFTAEVPAEALWVHAEASPINQVLEALLSNAFKFAAPNGQVVLSLERKDNQAHVMVSDTGAGIKPARLLKIFEAGGREAEGVNHRFGGLGISLNLAKEIIAHYQGKIWAESQPGYGSQLHFTLPISVKE